MEQLEGRLGVDSDFEMISLSDEQFLYLFPFEHDEGIYGYAGVLAHQEYSDQLQVVYDIECIAEKSCVTKRRKRIKILLLIG